MRTYTKVGAKDYDPQSIDKSIAKTNWVAFRTHDLPFCQGECIKTIVKECNIPISKISGMDLHGFIISKRAENTHAFYALDVKYKNGQAQIYIADNGCSSCVVASDFEPFKN